MAAPAAGEAPGPSPQRPAPPASAQAAGNDRSYRWALLAAAAVAGLAAGGYGLGWRWTGFDGSTLWDWLRLFILPVMLTAMPLWLRTRHTHRRHWRLAIGVLAAGFLIVAVGGYALHWRWTGFAGNTAWDWLQLVIVPFVIPAVVAKVGAGQPGR